MSLVTMAPDRPSNRDGVYRLSITGTGLNTAAASDTRARAQQQQAVAAAVVQAIAAARAAGRDSFAPSEGFLPLPAGISLSRMQDIFSSVLGIPYSGVLGQTPGYAPMSLSQWSDAALSLQQDAAALTSRLAPGQGGGVQHAGGYWYVNGQRFTLAESFLALRVANFASLDTQIAALMNRQSVNAAAARNVIALLSDLQATFASRGGSSGSYGASSDVVALLTRQGLGLSQMATWGASVSGGGTFASVQAAYASNPNAAVSGTDYAALITEAKAVFNSFNAENQVSQVRLDSIVNARQNVVAGMSAFMVGQQAQQDALARGLQGR